MAEFFTTIRRDFRRRRAARQRDPRHDAGDVHAIRRREPHHALHPPPFSMLKYQKEIDRLERAYNEHFNTLWNMLSKAKFSLTQGFFETVASRVKHVYDVANATSRLAALGDVAARIACPRAPPAALRRR
jgi:hypothetical protein